jgi:hypothetical protein
MKNISYFVVLTLWLCVATLPPPAAALITRAISPPAAPIQSNFVLRWSPLASQGLRAFEGLEQDRGHGHPGANHFGVSGDAFRIDIHTRDKDCSGDCDRQRTEVKGMRTASGSRIDIKKGQTWRFAWDVFIPRTLNATTSFTHIHQQKMDGVPDSLKGAPVVTLTLHIHSGRPSIELRLINDSGSTMHFNPTDLAPLQNKWVTIELTHKFDNSGTARMVIRDGSRLVTDRSTTFDLWREESGNRGDDRMRPKWGIYRSLKSSGLTNTNIMLRNMKAFQLQ